MQVVYRQIKQSKSEKHFINLTVATRTAEN